MMESQEERPEVVSVIFAYARRRLAERALTIRRHFRSRTGGPGLAITSVLGQVDEVPRGRCSIDRDWNIV
jgi:hypothetical protein